MICQVGIRGRKCSTSWFRVGFLLVDASLHKCIKDFPVSILVTPGRKWSRCELSTVITLSPWLTCFLHHPHPLLCLVTLVNFVYMTHITPFFTFVVTACDPKLNTSTMYNTSARGMGTPEPESGVSKKNSGRKWSRGDLSSVMASDLLSELHTHMLRNHPHHL